jgi:hypothetical protein
MPLTVTLELPDDLAPKLTEDAQRQGVSVEALVRSKFLSLYEQDQWEWGEVTDEERRAALQEAFEREDLWGSEEDKVWDSWQP